MRERNESAELISLISRERAENAFRDALNLFIGRGRKYSSEQIEKATGVSRRLIDCCRSYPFGHPDFRRLDFAAKLSVSAFLGADFTSEWLAVAAQGAFNLPDADDTPPGAIVADDAEDHAQLSDAARDGTFANDAATLKVVSTRMIARGMKLRSIAA
jgi:hypothetical protein